MKTWKPDTCECVVEEIYPDNPSDPIVGGRVLSKCIAHSSVLDEELYGVLYSNPDGENKVKNHLHRVLLGYEELKNLGLHQVFLNKNNHQITDFKNGIDYVWIFEGSGKDRQLKAAIKGASLDAAQKKSIEDHCEQKFGVKKVFIA